MARKVKFQFSGIENSIQEVNETYEDILSSLDCKYSKDKNADYITTFWGRTDEDVNSEHIRLIQEINREFCLAMFASLESILRTDFIIRCQLNKRDKLSRFYRSEYNPARRIYSYGFSDILMRGWKYYLPECSVIIDRINELFKYRNWLAHGRYWILPPNLTDVDYLTVYNACLLFVGTISSKLYFINSKFYER